MHRLMRKLRRELSLNGHHHQQQLSEEEAMRQVLLQHALARQEEQERWRRLALAEAEAQRQAALAAAPPFFAPGTAYDQAAMVPQWATGAAAPAPVPFAQPATTDEEAQVQRALEESRREEEERRRRQAAAEEEEQRAIAQRQRESEEEEYYRALHQQQQQRREAAAFGQDLGEHEEEDEEDDDEAHRAALEEAKQVQLALQLSLAERQQQLRARQQQQPLWDGLRAEGFADANDHLIARGGHQNDDEAGRLDRRWKGKEKVVDEDEAGVGDEEERELAEALRLSQLVRLPPALRAREEQAIYRATLINEQNREFEESQREDMVKEHQKRQMQRERELALERIAHARNKGATLPPEPAAGTPHAPHTHDTTRLCQSVSGLTHLRRQRTGTEGATELVVRMPDGRRMRRRFPPEATLEAIKDWVDVELAQAHEAELRTQGCGDISGSDKAEELGGGEKGETQAGSYLVGGYDLVTDFPRRVFTDMRESASQAGLCPRALLNLSRKQ